MKKILNFTFVVGLFLTSFTPVYASESILSWGHVKKYIPFVNRRSHVPQYEPYLEDVKELQIPQWEEENWYVEDWLAQKEPMELMRGFYNADIIRNQTLDGKKTPILTVGPNFYHLSGLDKRRVTQTIDHIYQISAGKENGSYFLKDWHTKKHIGVFDENGLRLY
ncbi:MAG: hypothetical protein AAF549_04420 [Pseudomonadota bacterium]